MAANDHIPLTLMHLTEDFIDGKCPTIPFLWTYEFRALLKGLGHMDSYPLRNGQTVEKPGLSIAGLSYIVDHGKFKTRNTMIYGHQLPESVDLVEEEVPVPSGVGHE